MNNPKVNALQILLFTGAVVVSTVLTGTAQAKEIAIEETAFFEVPAGFIPLNRVELSERYSKDKTPDHALGNRQRSIIIAWQFKEHAVTEDNLTRVRDAWVRKLARADPDIVWIKREITTIAGQQWLYLEMKSKITKESVSYYRTMLFTPLQGRLLLVHLDVSGPAYEKSLPVLRQLLQSLRFKLPG